MHMKAQKEPANVAVPENRVPATVEEAHEMGFRWQIEPFPDLKCWSDNYDLGAVKTREGLALFRSNSGGPEIVIPFVAEYKFGQPRAPKRRYTSGAVFSVDEEPAQTEIAPVLKTKAPPVLTPEEIEAERVSLWLVSQYYKRTVVARFKIRGTREGALESGSDRFGDGMLLGIREIKTPKRRSTKKSAKHGSRAAQKKLKMQTS